jgi:acetyl-CoA C-acetyltransferase
MNREIVILSGVRTAIGGYGGSLKDTPPSEMGATCVREAVARSGVDVKDVGHVVFGNIIHTDAHDAYLARVAGVKGGLPHETPALTLNRLCGSGLQAIITRAQTIMLDDADVTVAGGAENMSRAPYSSAAMRFGARMNDTKMVDMMVAALSDPFDDCHMA